MRLRRRAPAPVRPPSLRPVVVGDPVSEAATDLFGSRRSLPDCSLGRLDLQDCPGHRDYASVGVVYGWLPADEGGDLTRTCWLDAINACINMADVAQAFVLLSPAPVTLDTFRGISSMTGTWTGFFNDEVAQLRPRVWATPSGDGFLYFSYLTLDMSPPLPAEAMPVVLTDAHDVLLRQFEYVTLPGGSQ